MVSDMAVVFFTLDGKPAGLAFPHPVSDLAIPRRGPSACALLFHNLRHPLDGSLVKHPGVMAATQKQHPALFPEARQRGGACLSPKSDPTSQAAVPHGL